MITPQRTVVAGAVKLLLALDSSVMQAGDNESAFLRTHAIAVQRAIPHFQGDETRFAAYRIFFLPNPRPVEPPGGRLLRTRPEAEIRIGAIEVLALRSASLFRIGNTGALTADSRIHHIRHFNNVLPAGTVAENQAIRPI